MDQEDVTRKRWLAHWFLFIRCDSKFSIKQLPRNFVLTCKVGICGIYNAVNNSVFCLVCHCAPPEKYIIRIIFSHNITLFAFNQSMLHLYFLFWEGGDAPWSLIQGLIAPSTIWRWRKRFNKWGCACVFHIFLVLREMCVLRLVDKENCELNYTVPNGKKPRREVLSAIRTDRVLQ